MNVTNAAGTFQRKLKKKSTAYFEPTVALALTSKTPSSMVSRLTSKVPPPRSYTRMFFSSEEFSSRPYARAAAVGSLRIRFTVRPEMVAASYIFFHFVEIRRLGVRPFEELGLRPKANSVRRHVRSYNGNLFAAPRCDKHVANCYSCKEDARISCAECKPLVLVMT